MLVTIYYFLVFLVSLAYQDRTSHPVFILSLGTPSPDRISWQTVPACASVADDISLSYCPCVDQESSDGIL